MKKEWDAGNYKPTLYNMSTGIRPSFVPQRQIGAEGGTSISCWSPLPCPSRLRGNYGHSSHSQLLAFQFTRHFLTSARSLMDLSLKLWVSETERQEKEWELGMTWSWYLSLSPFSLSPIHSLPIPSCPARWPSIRFFWLGSGVNGWDGRKR